MGLMNKLFGFRWSMYVVRNDRELVYVMHENSPLRMVGYVMSRFANGSGPVPPWSLHLNFNKQHKSFELRPEHFSRDGQDVTELLTQTIEAIDPGWRVPGGEPIFLEAKSKKRLKISNPIDLSDLDNAFTDIRRPKELTFFDVMDEVFGKIRA